MDKGGHDMTPKRVVVSDMGRGARRVLLSCSCVRVGRIAASWESDEAVIALLLADHARHAPRCPHPAPEVTAWQR